MADPEFDMTKAHRWFAVECNNAAWELIEKTGSLSGAEIDALLHQAHASCFHWAHAGDALNHLRAYVLLSAAYARAERFADALHYAHATMEASDALGDEQAPFDRATALAAMANALHGAGHADEAARWRGRALDAAALLDREERGVFEQIFAQRVV